MKECESSLWDIQEQLTPENIELLSHVYGQERRLQKLQRLFQNHERLSISKELFSCCTYEAIIRFVKQQKCYVSFPCVGPPVKKFFEIKQQGQT